MPPQKITPFLWFDRNAEEAVNHYVGIFKNSRINKIMHCTDAGPWPVGKVMWNDFQLEGQRFAAMNGGPMYKFTEAISLNVDCTTQEEVDELWAKLGAGGAENRCGWLKDKFGLSWQIIPRVMFEMMHDADPVKATRVTRAVLTMRKINIEALRRAYDGVLEEEW